MGTVGMEPFVVDWLQFSALLHAGELIIYGVDKLLVVAHDTDFAVGDVDGTGDQSVKGQLLLLPHQGAFSPYKIAVAAIADSCKGIFRGAVFDRDSKLLLVNNPVGCIVVTLEDKRVGSRHLAEIVDWACPFA